MFQMLVWAACVLIFGVGVCAMYLEKLAAGDKVKSNTGVAMFLVMTGLAIIIFVLSLIQGQQISGLFK